MVRRMLALMLVALCAAAALGGGGGVRVVSFDESDGFSESPVTCVVQDSVGLIWLASWDGLYRYDGYRMRCYKARPGDNCPLNVNRIDYICELPGGDLLCRVRGEYFAFRRATGKFEHYEGPTRNLGRAYRPDARVRATVEAMPRYRGLPVRILLKDRQGGIWVQTMKGLDRISPSARPIAGRKAGTDPEEEVRALLEDRQGRLWVADKNGYVRLEGPGGQLVGYVSPSGRLEGRPVRFGHNAYCLCQDSRGWVWMGAKGSGLFRFVPAPGGFRVSRYMAGADAAQGLSHDDVYSIVEDSYGRMWIGTYGGGLNVATVAPSGSVAFASAAGGLPPLHAGSVEVHRLAITPGGVLLAGTNTGLYTARIERNVGAMRFHANRRDPACASSLSSNRVTDILVARSGAVFAATYGGGLCRVLSPSLLSDTLSFRPYTTESGLASDVVMSLGEDARGRLWLVSGASLSCFDPATEVSTNFKRSMFSGGFVFSEARPVCTAGGRMVIGTSQGVLEFNPDEVRKSGYVPPIVTSCPDRLELKPEERGFAIEMAALDYNKNEQIEYAYMLEGLDTEWNFTTDNHIRYANLPAGTYRLRIKSTNGDGIWTHNERTITIHRTPRFNERPLAWMLYGGLMLLAVWAAARLARYVRGLQRELSHIKMTMGERVEYAWLKHGEKDPGATAQQPDSGQGARDEAWAAKVRAYMEANIGNSGLSVDSFAQAMGMSRSVFYLNMKRVLGSTPNNFIQEARIARAKELLRARAGNVSEVAYRCGFSDPKYFSRCFKKATGVSPSEYS